MDRIVALQVGLLVDRQLDVAALHLVEHDRNQVEAGEQHFARLLAEVAQRDRGAGMPVAGVEIGGGRGRLDVGGDALADEGEIEAGVDPLVGDFAVGIGGLVFLDEALDAARRGSRTTPGPGR